MKTGSQVETGAPLLRLEPVADADGQDEAAGSRGADLELPQSDGEASVEERAARGLAGLSAILLGYDTDADTRTPDFAQAGGKCRLHDHRGARTRFAPRRIVRQWRADPHARFERHVHRSKTSRTPKR